MCQAVQSYGTNWVNVSKTLKINLASDKTSKQCRQRYNDNTLLIWVDHLNPQLNKSSFTEEEENIIFREHKEKGNKWVNISKLLKGR